MNPRPENLTVDELLSCLAHSTDPIAAEVAKRMTGSRWAAEYCDEVGSRGRTVQEIKEYGESIVVRFTDGAYLVIDTEVFDGTVDFCIGRTLLKSERFELSMMPPEERTAYVAEQNANAAALREKRIEQVRRELAELEAQP